MADDYVEWITGVLERKSHLSRAGLARQLGVHRSSVTQLLSGNRQLKASEIAKVEAYLGERYADKRSATSESRAFVEVVGTISLAWFEGAPPGTTTAQVARSLAHADVRQVAYALQMPAPSIDARPGDILIAIPIDRSNKPRPGQTVVVKRERAGLVNLAIAAVDADGHVEGKDVTLIATLIELRRQL